MAPEMPWEPFINACPAQIISIFNYACYFSEIYRGGIQSVPVGQEEKRDMEPNAMTSPRGSAPSSVTAKSFSVCKKPTFNDRMTIFSGILTVLLGRLEKKLDYFR